jgi:putative tryptophan/tyrosine transport system substrate-binding protein
VNRPPSTLTMLLSRHTRRREFIAAVGSVVTWPLVAHAQPGKPPIIGFLGAASASAYTRQVDGFRSGLRELGYIEGSNIVILYRWAEGRYERLPELAADLVRANVDVIVTHGTPGTRAAKEATTTIPIVMASIGDPVTAGVIASIARPGGNITGLSWFGSQLEAKKVELLRDAKPSIKQVGYLFNSDNASSSANLESVKKVANVMDVGLQAFPVRVRSELETAFEHMAQVKVEAVAVQDEGMLLANVKAISDLAMKWRLPSTGNTELAQAGGLVGYGVDFFALFHRAAALVDKILKGAKPADLPVEQASKFKFILNLRTAKALGIDMPASILVRATEVIE